MKFRFTAEMIIISLALTVGHAQTTQPSKTPPPAQTSEPLIFQDPAPSTNLKPQNTYKNENWSALSVADSGIPPQGFNAVVLGKYDEPDYTRELVRVQWRLGDPIELYVVRPKGIAKPPVVLYLYDYRYDTDRFRSDRWCKLTTQDGLAAVGFVSALSGQRFHAPRPMKEWFVSELQEALGTSTHDVQMVLNYLASRGDINTTSVGMYGEGTGGSIAILAAAVDPRIQVLDLLNPWGDWPDWLKDSPEIPQEERAAYLKPEFLQSVSNLDPVTYLPHLKLKGLRIQQIMDDPVTPPAAKDKIALAAPDPHDVVRYKDATGHLNAWKRDGITGWMKKQLTPPAQVVSKTQ